MTTTNDNVEVRISNLKGAGRGVFAKKAFSPGNLIFSLARPMVTELLAARLEDTCTWCCQKGLTDPAERLQAQSMGLRMGFIEIKPCAGCRKVSYCGKACQTKDWKLEHKFECKLLAPATRPSLPPGVRAVYKLVKRLQKGDEAVKDMLDFQDIREDVKRCNKKLFDELSELAYGSWGYADMPSMPDQNTTARLFFTAMCNTIGLSSAVDDGSLGNGWDPLLCSVNHSCEPNAFYLFNEPKTLLRASRKINRGDEIFIGYVDVYNPFSVRQAILKKSYYFDCACTKCAKGPTLVEDQFRKPYEDLRAQWSSKADQLAVKGARNPDIENFKVGSNSSMAERRMTVLQAEAFKIVQPEGIFSHVNSVEIGEKEPTIDKCRDSLRLCLESEMWALTRQPVPSILRKIFSYHYHNQDFESALHIGLVRQFVIAPVLQPQSFSRGRMLDTFALAQIAGSFASPGLKHVEQKLKNNGCDLQMLYLSLLFECWEELDKSYGKESPFGQVVAKKWTICTGGMAELPKEATTKLKSGKVALKAYAETIDVLKWLN